MSSSIIRALCDPTFALLEGIFSAQIYLYSFQLAVEILVNLHPIQKMIACIHLAKMPLKKGQFKRISNTVRASLGRKYKIPRCTVHIHFCEDTVLLRLIKTSFLEPFITTSVRTSFLELFSHQVSKTSFLEPFLIKSLKHHFLSLFSPSL